MVDLCFSGSSRKLAALCSASAALPTIDHVGSSEVGTALHEFVEYLVETAERRYADGEPQLSHEAARRDHSVQGELEEIADRNALTGEARSIFLARARGFWWEVPEACLSEVALGYVKGGAVEVAGGKGNYTLHEGAAPFAATIDLLWAEPYPFRFDHVDPRPIVPVGSTLHVVDVKTGDELYVEPVDHNAQLGLGAVLASRWVRWEGEPSVQTGILWFRKGPAVIEYARDTWTADRVTDEMRKLGAEIQAVRAQRKLLTEGKPLDGLVEGDHCTYCPARQACPAKVASVAALVGAERGLLEPGALSDEQLAKAVAFLPTLTRLADTIRTLAKARVEQTGRPLSLAVGKAWGPHPTKTKSFAVDAVRSVLEDVLGVDGASRAIDPPKVTAAGIKRELERQYGRENTSTVTKVMRTVYAKAGEVAGAIVETDGTECGPYKDLSVLSGPLSPAAPLLPGGAVHMEPPAPRRKVTKRRKEGAVDEQDGSGDGHHQGGAEGDGAGGEQASVHGTSTEQAPCAPQHQGVDGLAEGGNRPGGRLDQDRGAFGPEAEAGPEGGAEPAGAGAAGEGDLRAGGAGASTAWSDVPAGALARRGPLGDGDAGGESGAALSTGGAAPGEAVPAVTEGGAFATAEVHETAPPPAPSPSRPKAPRTPCPECGSLGKHRTKPLCSLSAKARRLRVATTTPLTPR